MGSVGVLVGGKLVTRPGVYPPIDASSMTPSIKGSGGAIIVIGVSDGGIPGQVYNFRTFDEAKTVIRGGTILSYIASMFNPSPTMRGASMVRFIRANATASPASLLVSQPLG